MRVVHLDQIVKSYPSAGGAVRVLDHVSFDLAHGETVALTGESGSGKSTLLHLIGGLDRAESGRLQVAGRDLTEMSEAGLASLRREHIGFVFQQFNLVASLTVEANIALQAKLAGRYDRAYAQGLADTLGLTAHSDKYPEQLSGGQQQRVAIARAMAAKPKLILADEPTGNLDEASSATVLDAMLTLVAQTGAALLLVTHSMHIAQQLSRHVHLRSGQLQ